MFGKEDCGSGRNRSATWFATTMARLYVRAKSRSSVPSAKISIVLAARLLLLIGLAVGSGCSARKFAVMESITIKPTL